MNFNQSAPLQSNKDEQLCNGEDNLERAEANGPHQATCKKSLLPAVRMAQSAIEAKKYDPDKTKE